MLYVLIVMWDDFKSVLFKQKCVTYMMLSFMFVNYTL